MTEKEMLTGQLNINSIKQIMSSSLLCDFKKLNKQINKVLTKHIFFYESQEIK